MLFFDAEDKGPARETSHPTYVRLCVDDLFYDCTAEFGPFGNDAGADGLSMLEDWYPQPTTKTVKSFIEAVLNEWGMAPPDPLATDPATVNGWLATDKLDAVREADTLVIAVAFGQLKIAGAIDDEVRTLARAALAREDLWREYWRRQDPTWAHAAASSSATARKRAVLEQL